MFQSIASIASSWSIVCVSSTTTIAASATFVRSTRSLAISASARDEQDGSRATLSSGFSRKRSATERKKSARVITPTTRPSSVTGTIRTRWWRKISATCEVGELAVDVDVLGVHVPADRLGRGTRSRFSSASSRLRRTNPAYLSSFR